MSLSDESFPEGELLLKSPSAEKCSFSNSATGGEQNTSSSLIGQGNYSSSTDGNHSSGPNHRNQDGKILDKKETVNNVKYSKKSRSCQDLHSDYTKKRYQHVKSKVKEYIASLKAQDQQRNLNKIIRQRSLPEPLSELNNNGETNRDHEDIFQKLQEKEEEVMQLRTLNEYLHNNLQEKLAQVARLQRTADYMRFELSEIKEKGRVQNSFNLHRNQFGFRRSLPILHQYNSDKITTATQTGNSLRSSPNCMYKHRTCCSEYSLSSNENAQRKERFHLRKLTNSNSEEFQKSLEENLYLSEDRATSSDNNLGTESETDAECQDELIKYKSSVFTEGSLPKKRKFKSTKLKKGCWKLIFKSCSVKMSCCNKNGSLEDEYSYSQLPQTGNELTPSDGVQV